MIVRPEAGLLDFTADHVRETIVERVRSQRPGLAICDLSASPRVDMHAAQMLVALQEELSHLGCRLQLVEARASVRDALRQGGIETINRFTSVADAVDDHLSAPSQSRTETLP